MSVECGVVQKCLPYRVRMVCGHFEDRMMREATAGIPWTPTAWVQAPYEKCVRCNPAREALGATMSANQEA